MTPEEYINKVKKDRWHAVSGGWLGTFVTEEDALAAIKLTREEMKAKEVAPIKCEKKSPITGGEMQLMQEKSSVKFRDEEITFIKKFYHCVDSGQDFTDTELDNDNMWAIFRAYWERRGFEHFYDIDGYRKEEKSALNRADIIHSEQYKVSRASVDWYQTHQDADCLDGFEAGAEWQKEQMMKDVEQLKTQAEKRYDEIGKSGYIQPNLHLAKGTDNIVTIEYANNHNKEHAASLGYYNGVIRTCEKILGILKDSANEGNNNH